MSGGEFVLSLDFELLWGVRDHATKDTALSAGCFVKLRLS